MISEDHRAWLMARGLKDEVVDGFGIDTKGSWLVIPYVEHGKVVNEKARRIDRKDHRMRPNAPLILCNHDSLLTGTDRVIVTEGEWDMLAAIQSGFSRVVSVPNGAPQEESENPWQAKRYEWVRRHEKELDQVKEFILATDGDAPGQLLAAELAGLLGPERCRFITYPFGCKDLNDVLIVGGEEAVVDLLSASKPYPVKGLYRFSDYPARPAVMALDSNLPGIRGCWPLVMRSFSVITGYSGIGKTSLLAWVIADYLQQGVRICIGSFETDPYVLRQKMRAVLSKLPYDHPLCEKEGEWDAMLEEQLVLLSQECGDEESEMTLEYLLDLARVAVLRDGVKLLVIDPWNEIEHKHDPGETEHDYTGRAIRMIKRFLRRMNIAGWLVAHPRKPEAVGHEQPRAPSLYSISGSAHWANKADYGITIHRSDKASPVTNMIVNKVRMGLPGREGRSFLTFNPQTSGYDMEGP